MALGGLGPANIANYFQSLASKELVRKQAHASHKAKNIVSTTRCLELLHMDLCGPSAIQSYGGNLKELLNVPFDETPPPPKTSPLEDDALVEEEAIESDEEETAENFKIETNVFRYETPLCLAFNEFNYLIKVDSNLLTEDIMRFKTYKDYKDNWIYEWNKDIPWVDEKPWTESGRKFPGAYHIGNSLYYQDLEWHEALEDSELKDEALKIKAIMEGLISDDESSNDVGKRWKSHENFYH
ncbi:hypothetical protein Tco_0603442 [Tanacetum coccineum]